jgi:UDP-glucuronate decarboxylase
VDEIYNLACPASPIHYQFDPVQTTKTSVHGAINMLGLAKRIKAKILQASTSEVYGDPARHPQTETTGATSTTRAAGLLRRGQALRRDPVLRLPPPASLRIKVPASSTLRPEHGRGRRPCGLQLHHPGPAREPLTVYGQGAQTRSFCYVDDLVEACAAHGQSRRSHRPVNLGNPGEFTILELARKVLECTGSRSEIVCKPLPSDDPLQRKPDITLARTALGWEPGIPLSEGLPRTLDYFRQILGAA